MSIFGVDWSELQLEHVEAFLREAGGEPLTWEAKGREVRPEAIAKQVGGFANALDGGYLLLGFEHNGQQWQATGFQAPTEDTPAWVQNIVRNRLRPSPRIDIRDWPVGERRVAVVSVEPVAEPPCITSAGQVFERVSGETIAVRDPAELRRLYDRGETAAHLAEATALAALKPYELTMRSLRGRRFTAALSLSLALAPVGRAPDISSLLFVDAMRNRLVGAIETLPTEPLIFDEEQHPGEDPWIHCDVRQDALEASSNPAYVNSWRLRAGWDGAVAIALQSIVADNAPTIDAGELLEDALIPMAKILEDIVAALGGHGRAHLAFHASGGQVRIASGRFRRGIQSGSGLRPIQRWLDVPQIPREQLDSVRRELLRACGIPAWEEA